MQYQRRRGECGCLVAESQRNNFIYGDPDTGSGKGFDRTLINNQHNVGNMGLHIQLNYLLFSTSCKACDVWSCSFVQSWEVCHNFLGFNPTLDRGGGRFCPPWHFMLWSPQYWAEGSQILVQFIFYSYNVSSECSGPKGCPRKKTGVWLLRQGSKSKSSNLKKNFERHTK